MTTSWPSMPRSPPNLALTTLNGRGSRDLETFCPCVGGPSGSQGQQDNLQTITYPQH